jgi:hypothetical protein
MYSLGYNVNAPTFTPQSALGLVSAAELNKRHRVNKRYRYFGTYSGWTPVNQNVIQPPPPPPDEDYVDAVAQQAVLKANRAGHGQRQSKKKTKKQNQQQENEQIITNQFPQETKLPFRLSPNKNPTKYLLTRPEPSTAYNTQAHAPSTVVKAARPLLVVLDLNGTLIHRTNKTTFKGRPGLDKFLGYLLANHKIVLWSSAKKVNVESIANRLFSEEERKQLLAVWAREDCRIPNKWFGEKVQVYKQLEWLWQDEGIQNGHPHPAGRWGQKNTVLIDDSVEKAASEPYNLLQIEVFEGKRDQMQSDVLAQVEEYLEMLKWQSDVSAYMRTSPFQYEEGRDGGVEVEGVE